MKTGTRLGLGFGVQILLAGALGISVLLGMADVRRLFQFVAEHDAPVIANARQLSMLVVDMETGQRGFVITARDDFLEPYHSGAEEFDTLLEEEKELVSDNPPQVAALERIDGLVREWKEKAAVPEISIARKVAAQEIDAEHLQQVLGRGDPGMRIGQQRRECGVTLGDLGPAAAERRREDMAMSVNYQDVIGPIEGYGKGPRQG